MGGGKGGEGGGDRVEELMEEETMNTTTTAADCVDDADYSAVRQQQQPQHQVPEWNGASGSKSTVKGGGRTLSGKETGAKAGTSGGMETPAEDYEVVYVKDNVSVHPTQHANGRISGRLRLIKQGPSLFMQTWIPYAQGGATNQFSNLVENSGTRNKHNMNKAADRDRNLYTIRAISLAEMRSIRRHTPPLGWQYIIIVLQSGLAFPPLYFHNGGVREFLNTLNLHASLVRSPEDANVYLVNDIQDPLQRSLTSLDLTVSPAPNQGSFSDSKATMQQSEEAPRDIAVTDRITSESSILVQSNRNQKDPARDISLQVLEKFSLVTKFARDTTAQLFGGESRMLSFDNLELDHGPAPRRLQDLAVSSTLASPQNIIPDSPPKAGEEQSKQDAEKKADDEHASTNVGTFELVDGRQNDSPPLVWGRARPPPLGSEEWTSFMDSEGRVVDPKALKKRIFHGGLEPGLRPQVWKFLLGYFLFDSTYAEREVLVMQKREEYAVLKAQWQTVSEEQAKRFAKYRERKHRVEKDVVRTDRSLPFYEGDDNVNVTLLGDILVTYSFYNFDLGYCQGMSDLLSPILYIIRDESEAFWCFASLMERMAPNFHRDQNGMHSQLLALSKLVQLLDGPLHDYFKQADCLNYFFCFRWILIQFKREFDYDNVLRLWEVLWSHYLSEHFHLYICVALLKRHRRKIMDEQMEFDTLLKFINELSGHIPLESTLRDAEALCLFAGDRGVACIPPGTPPALPTIDQSQ
ncbi:unnamed protein product [Calypogeia fissa]